MFSKESVTLQSSSEVSKYVSFVWHKLDNTDGILHPLLANDQWRLKKKENAAGDSLEERKRRQERFDDRVFNWVDACWCLLGFHSQ